jgi:hypothetical protein
MKSLTKLIKWLFVTVLWINLSVVVYGRDLDSFVRADQCGNCGEVLVGAALIQPDVIQWIGNNSPSSF